MKASVSEWATVEVIQQIVAYNPETGVFTDKRNGKVLKVAPGTKLIRLRKPDGDRGTLSPGATAWILQKGERAPGRVCTRVKGRYEWRHLYVAGFSPETIKEKKTKDREESFQRRMEDMQRQLDVVSIRLQKRIEVLEKQVAYFKLLAEVTEEIDRRGR